MNLLLFTRTMTKSEVRALLDPASIPTYTMPSFVAFTELDPAEFDEFVDMASEKIIDRIIRQYQHEEKYKHAPEKKRPWKLPKTRFPLEGKLKKLLTDTNFKKNEALVFDKLACHKTSPGAAIANASR